MEVIFEQRLKSSEGVSHGVSGTSTWKAVSDVLPCEEKNGLLNIVYNMALFLYKHFVYVNNVVYSSWDGCLQLMPSPFGLIVIQ